MLALAVGPVDPFWPCAPAVRRSPHRLSTCTFAGGKKNPEHKGRRKRRGGARKTAGGNSNGARPKAPKKLPLVTGPPKIETQSVLQAVAPTLDPWWSTFVSHVEGVWAGKCAAFNMADGKMEPMMIEGDNIKIKELHTRVREAGGQIDNNAALLRETLKELKLVHMDAFSDHAEKSCLMAGAAGLLHFDGGSYSSSLSDLGTNSAGDEDVLPDEQLFGAEVTTGGWGQQQDGDEDAGDYRTDIGATEANTDADTNKDTATGTEEEEEDVWSAGASDSRVPDVSGLSNEVVDEDAEWRQVARAEMLEEHYRGAGKVATLEHCLAVGGQERIRLQLLLETRGGRREELDVQVLRMVLFKEYWMGVGSDADNGGSPPLHKLNIAEAKRADAREHSGKFLCLTLTSAIIPPLDPEVTTDSEDASLYTDASEDEGEHQNIKNASTEHVAHDTAQNTHSHSGTTSDANAEHGSQEQHTAASLGEQGGDVATDISVSGGEAAASGGDKEDLDRDRGSVDEGVVKAHFSTEVQQHWESPEGDFGEDGVTWWLPHDVTCTMMMAPSTRAASEWDKSRLGLVVRTTWKRDGFMSVMETQFSPAGELEESRFSSLVPENNSIPSMNVPVGGVAK